MTKQLSSLERCKRDEDTVVNNLTLYTTECPKCKVLERKLSEKGVAYTKCTDTNLMLSLGIQQAPVLGIDDKMLDFSEALNWIRGI